MATLRSVPCFRFAGVTGIQIQHIANRFAKGLVCVAEHDDVRPFARDAELEFLLQRVRIHDVVNEKFAIGERNHFGDPESWRTIRVAEHGRDRGNRLQFRR